MLVEIINKVLLILLFMSSLNVIRHTYYFIQSFMTSTEETPLKYKISNTSLFVLSASIAYVLSVIFTGIKI